MLISLWIRVELYLINVLCNYASIINILPYFANTVSAWQLCQCFDFDCIYTVCDNERVVFFIYKWNYANYLFLNDTLYL